MSIDRIFMRSIDILVEMTRLELVSEHKSARASPSAGCNLNSLCRRFTAKAAALVASVSWQRAKQTSAHVHRLNDASVRNAVIPEETTLQLGSVS